MNHKTIFKRLKAAKRYCTKNFSSIFAYVGCGQSIEVCREDTDETLMLLARELAGQKTFLNI